MNPVSNICQIGMMFLLFLLVIGHLIMVRHYKKKGVYSQHDITNVEEIVANYRSGKLPLRKYAKKYGIPRSTISDHALGKVFTRIHYRLVERFLLRLFPCYLLLRFLLVFRSLHFIAFKQN